MCLLLSKGQVQIDLEGQRPRRLRQDGFVGQIQTVVSRLSCMKAREAERSHEDQLVELQDPHSLLYYGQTSRGVCCLKIRKEIEQVR